MRADRLLPWILAALAAACVSSPPPPETSVRPDVNSRFLDPALDVSEFVSAFEGESREIARERDAIVAALDLEPGMRVADVGAGTGLFLESLARGVGDHGRVSEIELSPAFVAHLKERASASGMRQVEVVQCTDHSIEMPPASIDAAFVCDTYHHFEFPRSTLASIHAALRPGGVLYVLDFERIEGESRQWVLDHVRAGKDVVCAEIEAAGFDFDREIEVEGLSENYLVRFVRR
jgi:predicted methyltransferase